MFGGVWGGYFHPIERYQVFCVDSLQFLSESLPLYLSLIALNSAKGRERKKIHEEVKLLLPPQFMEGY